MPSVADAVALGLTAEEYELICEKQGGPPNRLELAMYSLLWSEHCAYKHSRLLLRTLPTEGRAVVLGPGENAGVVDVGSGLLCAMKVESHNHPSAVEPFQGAATGVGGILRDIFAVGARPIAVLDSLRFGEPTSARSRYLLDGVVRGVGHYGNSIGVPTVGGEVYFEPAYEQSCLVNVMALGLARRDELIRSAATGPGNALLLFGARTGRDGIGGASVLASADLEEGAQDKRPSVQVGDPFEEKKLLECSLELLRSGLLVALQDLGAAGLTSSAAEMASKGGVGMDIDITRVPLREPGMEPFEVMVSESQERMLCVVEPDHVDSVLALCEHWEVEGCVIGEITADPVLRVHSHGVQVGAMPVRALVDECPLYALSPEPPTAQTHPAPLAVLAADASPRDSLLALLGAANIADRTPLFEQYDCLVQSRTVRAPAQADAAVLALTGAVERAAGSGPGAPEAPVPGLAVSIDGNGRRVAADPYWGTVEAVLECAANLACAGAEVLGVTDNLNFGNPTKGLVAWQLTESVRGLGDACRALQAPIVGGNVSLYNDGPAGPIHPTPVVGMLGGVPDVRRSAPIGFRSSGSAVALAGPFRPSLAACELEKLCGQPLPLGLPAIHLGAVRAAQVALRDAVRAGLVESAHDISDGGLAVALAECALAGGIGAEVMVSDELLARAADAHEPQDALRALLFGEGAGGFLVSGEPGRLAAIAP
ncbi:MAG: phosphoribosylformylglycinamidine synthase subunit PurL, partial [Acidobacteriota bacterium]|nr:phosphoribosylformylglycinamidine synthase subunit PurL [Acidobacteriota bacterium]